MTDNTPDHEVFFMITGRVRVPANLAKTPEDAKAYVDREYDEAELAESYGTLETYDGEPVKQLNDHASRVHDIYLEQLRQDMAEEQRHG